MSKHLRSNGHFLVWMDVLLNFSASDILKTMSFSQHPSRRSFIVGSSAIAGVTLLPRESRAFFPGFGLLITGGFLLISTIVANAQRRGQLRRAHYNWLRKVERRQRGGHRSMLGCYGSQLETDFRDKTHGLEYHYPGQHGGTVEPLATLGIAALYQLTGGDAGNGRAVAPLYSGGGQRPEMHNGGHVYECQVGDRWLRKDLEWNRDRIQAALKLIGSLEGYAAVDTSRRVNFGLDNIKEVLPRFVMFEDMHS